MTLVNVDAIDFPLVSSRLLIGRCGVFAQAPSFSNLPGERASRLLVCGGHYLSYLIFTWYQVLCPQRAGKRHLHQVDGAAWVAKSWHQDAWSSKAASYSRYPFHPKQLQKVRMATTFVWEYDKFASPWILPFSWQKVEVAPTKKILNATAMGRDKLEGNNYILLCDKEYQSFEMPSFPQIFSGDLAHMDFCFKPIHGLKSLDVPFLPLKTRGIMWFSWSSRSVRMNTLLPPKSTSWRNSMRP